MSATLTQPKTGLAVDVRNLTVAFGDFKAVDNVTFKVKRGEIFGFLGANGAGKTTTIRVLCGLLRPSAGEIHVGGEAFGGDNSGLKRKSGYMSQRFTLYTDMTVAENMDFTATLRRSRSLRLWCFAQRCSMAA